MNTDVKILSKIVANKIHTMNKWELSQEGEGGST